MISRSAILKANFNKVVNFRWINIIEKNPFFLTENTNIFQWKIWNSNTSGCSATRLSLQLVLIAVFQYVSYSWTRKSQPHQRNIQLPTSRSPIRMLVKSDGRTKKDKRFPTLQHTNLVHFSSIRMHFNRAFVLFRLIDSPKIASPFLCGSFTFVVCFDSISQTTC